MNAVPAVAITNGSGQRLTFPGRKVGANGKYAARVVFPSAGRWSYQVTVGDYFREQAQGPFVVAPAKQPSRMLAALPPVGAVLLVFGTGLLLRRRRH